MKTEGILKVELGMEGILKNLNGEEFVLNKNIIFLNRIVQPE